MPLPEGKTRITIRLDDEILSWFKAKVEGAGGGNYQSLINAALLEHIKRIDEPLEKTLRLCGRSCAKPANVAEEVPGFVAWFNALGAYQLSPFPPPVSASTRHVCKMRRASRWGSCSWLRSCV